MKNPVSFSSIQNAPLSVEPSSENTERLNGRVVKAFLNSVFDTYGDKLLIIVPVIAYLAFGFALATCPKYDQNKNEMSCPVPPQSNIYCIVSGYCSFIAIIVTIAIPLMPAIARKLPD